MKTSIACRHKTFNIISDKTFFSIYISLVEVYLLSYIADHGICYYVQKVKYMLHKLLYLFY